MLTKATILGVVREPVDGYDVDGRAFNLYVDSVLHTISFTYGAKLPLDEVVSQINTQVGASVASRDNGFLRLTSTTTGDGSSLRLETDPASSPTDVFFNLGLFAETESYSGDIVQAAHVDPDRQVATPGQMTMAEGESFNSKIVNRAIYQLAVNNDRNEGIISKKRVAKKSFGYDGVYSSPGAAEGVQLSGGKLVYVGDVTAPTTAQLKKLFSVQSGDGRELAKKTFVPSYTNAVTNFYIDDQGRQIAKGDTNWGNPESLLEKNAHVMSTNFTGEGAALNGIPMKILEVFEDPTGDRIAIDNVDPATGQRYRIYNEGSFENQNISAQRGLIVFNPVLVDGVYANVTDAAAGTNRLENVPVVKRSGISPTRVEQGNRVVFVGEDFLTTNAILEGDEVTWAGSTVSEPFSNNGSYRVDRIIDKETLKLVASDFGPVYLNSDLTSGSPGTVTIQTDGQWVLDPFLRFDTSGDQLPPDPGDAVAIKMLEASTLRGIADDPTASIGGAANEGVLEASVQRAIMNLWGNTDSFDDVLYGDLRQSIQGVRTRISFEHYDWDESLKDSTYWPAMNEGDLERNYGKHKDIRPDTINMWPWYTGDDTTPRTTLRGIGVLGHSSGYDDDIVAQVENLNEQITLRFTARGHIDNANGTSPNDHVGLNLYYTEGDSRTTLKHSNGVESALAKFGLEWTVANLNSSSLLGLGTDMLISNVGGGSFTNWTGARIGMVKDDGHAVTRRFLHLTGTDGLASVNGYTTYGIHYDHSWPAGSGHTTYGLYIADQTTDQPSKQNWAIYTSGGKVRHRGCFNTEVTNPYNDPITDSSYRTSGMFVRTLVDDDGWTFAGSSYIFGSVSRIFDMGDTVGAKSGVVGMHGEAWYAGGAGSHTVGQIIGVWGHAYMSTGSATAMMAGYFSLGEGTSYTSISEAYGIRIEDFPTFSPIPSTRVGVDIGSIPGGYAIRTATSGSALFQGGVEINRVGSGLNSTTTGYGVHAVVQDDYVNPTGGSVGYYFDYLESTEWNGSFDMNAFIIRSRRNSAYSNSGWQRALRIVEGSMTGGSLTNHAALYIDDFDGASNNYAIYTNLGKVHFGDILDMFTNRIENVGEPLPDNDSDVATRRFVVSRTQPIPNMVLNGNGLIDQRGGSPYTLTSTPQYTLDRWRCWDAGNSGDITVDCVDDNAFGEIVVRRAASSTTTSTVWVTQELPRSYSYFVGSRGYAGRNTTLQMKLWGGADFSGSEGGSREIRVKLISANAGATSLAPAVTSSGGWASYGTTVLINEVITVSSSRTWVTIPSTGTHNNSMGLCVQFTWNPTGTAGASDYFRFAELTIVPEHHVDAVTYDSTPKRSIWKLAGGSWQGEFKLCQRFFYKTNAAEIVPGSPTQYFGAWLTNCVDVSVPNGTDWPLGLQPRPPAGIATQGSRLGQGGKHEFADTPNINPTVQIWALDGTPDAWTIGGVVRNSSTTTDIYGFRIRNNTGGAVTPSATAQTGGHFTFDCEIV